MKIAIVNRHPSDVLGGSEMQCDNIAQFLAEKGHDVTYLAPAGRKGADYNRNYKVVAVDSNAASIIAAVSELKPDIVYWRLNKYYLYKSTQAISKMGIPIVFAISHIDDTKLWSYRENPKDGIVSLLRCIKQSLLTLGNHAGFRYVNGVTSNNPDFLNRLPVNDQAFVPNSVDTTVVPFSWPRPYVTWVANIKPQKQPELFVKLAKLFPQVDFLMIGKIHSDVYHWIATENQRTPIFHFLGPKTLQEVNGVLAQTLFLVHTCKPEGFPNNFLQAWFQKKPTVSLAFDPAGFIVKNSLGGFADGNWDLFVKQVGALIDDEQFRDETGMHAYNFASNNFSFPKTADKVEGFLQEVLSTYKAA